jgi:hypothetical protein
MPYALQAFYLPEWERPAPEGWERRLREISPITEKLSHLRFRFREPDQEWFHADRGQWMLYSCTPRALIDRDRAEQFLLHWSELSPEKQVGRKSVVSDYQHFMWHVHGVEARPFWILQGEWGGVPAKYSRMEKRYLDAMNAVSDELPLGFLPACQFDERAVRAIQKRDRLVQAGMRLEELERINGLLALAAVDQAAEEAFRKTFLDEWIETMKPQADFMRHWLSRSENRECLPAAPAGLSSTISMWQDEYVKTGTVIGAKVAASRAVQVPVSAAF